MCGMGKSRIRPVPDALVPLFHAMADEGPGVLSVLSVSTIGVVRMRHDVSIPGRLRVRRDFSLRVDGDLVQVRVTGYQSVTVSPVPSAVLAVALR